MADTPLSGYAPVNGMELYWESRGAGGCPLLVVHGGFGLASMFGELLDDLAVCRRVIAIELQGHGHTGDIDRAFSFEAFGDDIAGVVEHLGLGRVDLLGYSLGGSACLRAALQHPGVVRRLALVSIPCRREGWFPEVLEGMSQLSSAGFDQMRQSPMYEAWSKVAPDLSSFPSLMDKTGNLLRTSYDWTDEIRALDLPTLLVYADADSIPPRTRRSSSPCSAEASETPVGMDQGERTTAWRSCPASRTTTSSALRDWRQSWRSSSPD
jgi:pimeloyl-ACP methyl ester carboxylesterase